MRPEDDKPDLPESDGADAGDAGDTGEHEVPPPSTWAGRKRAGAGDDEPDDEQSLDDGDLPSEPEQAAREEEEEAPADEATDDTVEAETLALADRVEAEEAALAGLRARAADHEAAWDTGAHPAEEEEPTGEEEEEEEPTGEEEEEEEEEEVSEPEPDSEPAGVAAGNGKPPRAKPLWARFLAASLLIVVSMAAATSISLLVYFSDFAEGLSDNHQFDNLRDQLAAVEGGDPQTILILGSDERLSMKGEPRRSDTAILLRINPDTNQINLLSIPRDLKVNIPNHGTGKFNEAYTYGGPKLTLRVVKQLTGIPIQHLVNINFTGFADAVDEIDCVYIDVDRHYFNDNSTALSSADQYAEIDIEAGYQRLCGFKALQYVRYRHTDNDLVRAARQQDFLREARQKVPPEKLITDRADLLKIFTDYTTSDIADPETVIALLKTLIEARNAQLREIHFPANLGQATSTFVTASDEAIKETVHEFLGEEPAPEPNLPADEDSSSDDEGDKGDKGGKNKPDKEPEEEAPSGPAMLDASGQTLPMAQKLKATKRKDGDPMLGFDVYYPTRLVPSSIVDDDSRAFVIDGPDKEVYHGYKIVVDKPGTSVPTEYYGVSGTDWQDPPILANPSDSREIEGRDYLLYYDGGRLRLIGWKTKNASYWVNNTLSQTLSEAEMISIATSMRELGD